MGLENVPDRMLACQIVEYGRPYQVREVATPKELKGHDILVKVAVASLCHTDSMVAAGFFPTPLPRTASHEASGTIVAVGPAVAGLAVGDRVMCGFLRDRCGTCRDCRGPESSTHYCARSAGTVGVTLDGAFAEYVVADARHAARVPAAVRHETAAPLACAGATVFRGVGQCGLARGQWLAIVGAGGGLGHLGVQFARAMGLRVIGIDARDEGLALAREMGAEVVLDAREGRENVLREVHGVTEEDGADATICVSDHESAAGLACAVTKKHGTMVQIAVPVEVRIPFEELIFRDIHIQGSFVCSPEEAQRMLRMVAENSISVKTNAFDGLREIPKLVALAHGGHMQGKGIVIVDREQIDLERKAAVALV